MDTIMFNHTNSKMSLDIVFGPMFSGKSSYAMSYIRRQRAIGKQVLVIKPDIDTRYSDQHVIVTHNGEQLPCKLWDSQLPLTPTADIENVDSVVIEEAQFFKELYSFVKWVLLAKRKNILLVGLDGDASQQTFGELLQCIPYATNVTKLHALCETCRDGTLAPFTKRRSENNDNQIDVGGVERYMPVCLKHM
jgi:thymidine kinase